MKEELYNKLKEEFYRCNHVKYRKYFEEWIYNVTEAQIKWWANHWGVCSVTASTLPLQGSRGVQIPQTPLNILYV